MNGWELRGEEIDVPGIDLLGLLVIAWFFDEGMKREIGRAHV